MKNKSSGLIFGKNALKMLICLMVAFVMCFAACENTGSGSQSSTGGSAQPTVLSAPVVTVDENGLASWQKISGASGYEYAIDDGESVFSFRTSVQLERDQSIRVKAFGNGTSTLDSEWSAVVTYTKIEQKKLPTPRISIDANGRATWAALEGNVYYLYIINGGEPQTTYDNFVYLSDGETIKVKAVSDDENVIESNYSELAIYLISACAHSDSNSDGYCDICMLSLVVDIDFYVMNDLHGKFMDTSEQPGLDEFTAYMKDLYADGDAYEILLSSGDMWQGTVESSSNKGRLMTEWMNDVGFVSMTLGNHEYDWGPSGIKNVSELANFPFLAININYNGKPVDYCQPSVIVERGGVKVGIIGAIGDCLSSISGEYTQGLSFTTGNALTNLIKDESSRLREQENCDFIVLSCHDSYDNYYDESLSNGYIDLVFEGHTHSSYIYRDSFGVYHLQGGGENRAISNVCLKYNTLTGKYVLDTKTISMSKFDDSSMKDDPIVQNLFNKYFPDYDPYTTVLGKLANNVDSYTICQKIADLYYEFGQSHWGDRYNIVYGGGYFSARSPYKLYKGNVTFSQIFSVLPFDNQIVLCSVSGADLKSKFINSTNSKYYGCYESGLENSISDNKTYYIVVDSYTSTYAPNNLTEIERYDAEYYARNFIADFIKGGGWCR